MSRIHLKGKTLKGKNRVREHGSEYEVIRIEDKVGFTSAAGPWMLLQSIKFPDKIRWVHATHDENFTTT